MKIENGLKATGILTTIFLAGCYAKISSTGIQFEGEDPNLTSPKSIYAFVKPNGNDVRDVEVEITATVNGTTQGPITIPRNDNQGNPIIQQNGNRFYLENNIFLNELNALDEAVAATWRFTFGGAMFTPIHQRDRTFNYVAALNDVAIPEATPQDPGVEFANADGTLIEPTTQNEEITLFEIPFGQPINVKVRLSNSHSQNAVSSFVPVRIQEMFPGGALVSGGVNVTRNHVGGIAVGETVLVTFSNVVFGEPATGNILRQVRIQANMPPATNPVLLEENLTDNDNFVGELPIIRLVPAP